MSNKLEEARRIINDVDAQMAELFVKRMRAVETVSKYKQEVGLPILDPAREEAVIARNAALVEDEVLRGYYVDYIKHAMAISRAYQTRLQGGIGDNVIVQRGILAHAKNYLHLDRRVLVVTDNGVPREYAATVARQCRESIIYTIEQGEGSKSLEIFGQVLQTMLDHGFSRKDCVVAVGGGVVGDVAGFAASAYMRGVDFYNIPTTLLSQIDSSIGGKTAVNVGGVKNIVGAFYQPHMVLIDPDLLKTLPARQMANGLAEAIKMALTSDQELFALLENESVADHIDDVIVRSLRIKQGIVAQDEKEAGLRRVLNFGHTVGHGIESTTDLYHGECVALGMLPLCGAAIRPRVINVLKKCDLYRKMEYNWDAIAKAAFHDKKADGDTVTVVTVDEVGSFEMKTMLSADVIKLAKNCLEGL